MSGTRTQTVETVTIQSVVDEGWNEAELRSNLAQLGYATAKNPQCTTFPVSFKPALNRLKSKGVSQSPSQQKGIAPDSAIVVNTPTDDEALNIACETGIELDIVLQAAKEVDSLELLVIWAEEYQQKKLAKQLKRQISQSVDRQIQIEDLEDKRENLESRLRDALTLQNLDIAGLEKRLGVKVPESLAQLAANQKAGEEPDFLKDKDGRSILERLKTTV